MTRFALFPLALLLAASPALADTLSLDQALSLAAKQHPRLAQSRARMAASRAREESVGAARLPQVSVSSGAQVGVGSAASANPSLSAGVSQLLYDFGQTDGRTRSARALAEAETENGRMTEADVAQDVRTAYAAAQSAHVLVGVAQEAQTNQQRHVDQIQRLVQIGTRAPIDLALARRDAADSRLQLIRTQGDEAVARARLVLAMGGDPSDASWTLSSDPLPAVPGEDRPLDDLLAEASRARPDLLALDRQLEAQDATLAATQAGRWPTLKGSVAGTPLSRAGAIDPGADVGLTLSWPLWNGGAHAAEVSEAEATRASLRAQRAQLAQQVRLDLAQAQLAIRTAREAAIAAATSTRASQEQLQLAEGRYAAGVGSILELSDAQLALVRSRGQEAQVAQQLATARAQLIRALGRTQP